ncbi:hypothetical protein SARC_06559 [Sphaeroforma arctica JP610]|uniref:Uncharacterized protein n=1 Tax=Sphaeroforma arctica JP610 TaxID=667725 RepID=A0A0L0FYS6_9EUKA|nr:hypothetical protein SARC_06559 [Sphaeroforma arctica JP610]KNC81098.1 hypothetical protein SARC_06559 [Sphaeroforma arctica JP610]|eukprot:XP_014155000.1 hypothetical protein SARC_06559 [Sphaeroforma arctica JP610]
MYIRRLDTLHGRIICWCISMGVFKIFRMFSLNRFGWWWVVQFHMRLGTWMIIARCFFFASMAASHIEIPGRDGSEAEQVLDDAIYEARTVEDWELDMKALAQDTGDNQESRSREFNRSWKWKSANRRHG